MAVTGNYHLDRFEDNFGAYEDETVGLHPSLYPEQEFPYDKQEFLCDAGCGEEVTSPGLVCRKCYEYIVNG